MKKIIVAHPFRQHSFKLAEALNEKDLLFAYCTTVYDKKNSLMGILKKFIKGDLLKKANGRKCDGINDNQVVLFCEIRGYLALLINRMCPYVNISRIYQRYLYSCFGKRLAKYALKNQVDAVILFDTTATACFDAIKKKNPNIKCILDMAAISRPYAKKIYEEEQDDSSNEYKISQKYLWQDSVMRYMNKELMIADYFFVASDFVKNSLKYCEISDNKIIKLPYGVDLDKFTPTKKLERSEKLQLLYVGSVACKKGIHHLLKALDSIDPDKVELHLYGVYNKVDELYHNMKSRNNVYLHGFATTDKLSKIYSEADVFVFPSTNDGYGFVVLEALACGLPVICSNNAGACDIIKDYRNGFKFDSGNISQIVNLIQWCLYNRDKLVQMRQEARNSVLSRTWDGYNKKLISFIINEI